MPLASEWGVLQGSEALKAGTLDLEETRQWLYDTHGIIPRVSLGHKGKLTRLRVACDDGACVILPEDERAPEVEAFLLCHGIGYRGQSLAAAVRRATA